MTLRTPPFALALLLLFPNGGCAGRRVGGRPHDMGTVDHDAAAPLEVDASVTHGVQYDPGAVGATAECAVARAGGRVCWTAATNPTAAHQEEAARHAKLAADHRAASAALRSAEAAACVGINPEDRDTSPFDHRGDITSVTALTVHRGGGKGGYTARSEGAVVTLRAVPGLTSEWLQRAIDCHLARNASLGHDVPEMPDCPLVPKGAEASVISRGDGFAVTIHARQEAVADDILARARRLVPRAAPGE